MATSLKELKKNRSLAGLAEAVEKLSGSNFTKPEEQLNFWKPTSDKAGNGSAIIRFLPAPKGEDQPFVRTFTHGFMGPTDKWFIENCPTTLAEGTPCPVCEYNSTRWLEGEGSEGRIFVSGDPSLKPPRPGSKRKKSYVANVLIVKDSANSENEGKVFKYAFGQKIFDKLSSAIKGDTDLDIASLDPFDPWEGANFKLKFGNSNGQRSYDSSVFDSPSPIAKTDAEIEKVWEQAYSLAAVVAPSTIKEYSELQRKLNYVVGNSNRPATTVQAASEDSPEMPTQEAPKSKTKEAVIAESDEEADTEDFEKYLEKLGDD